jgi:hypothetical protein
MTIARQLVFFSYSIILSCVLSRGATYANFIVFGWPTGDRTRNLPHLRQTHLTITQLRWFCSDYDAVTLLLKVIKLKNLYGIHITYYHFRLNLGEFEEFNFYFWTLSISTLLNVYKNNHFFLCNCFFSGSYLDLRFEKLSLLMEAFYIWSKISVTFPAIKYLRSK